MWNQWPIGPPPLPASTNSQSTLIGPVQPTATMASEASLSTLSAPTATAAVPSVSYHSGAPSYTPAQFAAMTPEQQYAVQQHWQQWRTYEQQYAQWHAQYGEQYKREMAAIQNTSLQPTFPYGTSASVTNAYNYPPPVISNSYQAPPIPVNVPPPPPPDDQTNPSGIKASAQIYNQPPPPPPPPQQEGSPQSVNSLQLINTIASQKLQNQEKKWTQPPPPIAKSISENTLNEKNEHQMSEPIKQTSRQSDWQQENQLNVLDLNQQNTQQLYHQPQHNLNQCRNNQLNQQANNINLQGPQNQNNVINQNDDLGRSNWQRNRNNNNFRGRNRGRNNNNVNESNNNNNTYNNEHQFGHSETGNNFQNQSRQQPDNSGERQNRGNFSNRFDRGFDNFHNNKLNQNNNQSRNLNTFENHGSQQLAQNETTTNENMQRASNSGSVDEKIFDEQFQKWEEQFENWKKENANHPDRVMYMEYEKQFEKTRVRLLERREQMRRRKLLEAQQKSNSKQEIQQKESRVSPKLSQAESLNLNETLNNKSEKTFIEIEKQQSVEPTDIKECDTSDVKKTNSSNDSFKKSEILKDPAEEQETINTIKNVVTFESNIFQTQNEKTEFVSTGEIPGLDLVSGKEDDIVSEKGSPSHVIDLDIDGPARPLKLSTPMINNEKILPTLKQHSNPSLRNQNCGSKPSSYNSLSPNSLPPKRKIPSLFDIVVEKPILSPDPENTSVGENNLSESEPNNISKDHNSSKFQPHRSLLQTSTEQLDQQSFSNQQNTILPEKAVEIAKVLQDPNVIQLLNVALVEAKKSGSLNPNCNIQQNQFLQQLQQLQPLIQIQRDNSTHNQLRNNNQLQQTQPWQNRSQIFDRNDNFFSPSIGQGENSLNSFNTDLSQSQNRKEDLNNCNTSECTVGSDQNRDMQKRNSRNPFRSGAACKDNHNKIGHNMLSSNIAYQGQTNFCGLEGNRGNMWGRNFDEKNFDERKNSKGNFEGNLFGGGITLNKNFNSNDAVTTFGNGNNTISKRGFRNNSNNFDDRRVGDNDFFRPAQIFDYQNRSHPEVLIPHTKVVDYGHMPSALLSTTSLSRDNSEFVPVKTIDYGHASTSVMQKSSFLEKSYPMKKNINNWNQDQNLIQNKIMEENQYQTSISQNDELKEESLNKNESENETNLEYPQNKWILQNPESRQRPGLPTKRGKRNSKQIHSNSENKRLKDNPQENIFEKNKIEENFEEISDNECMIDESNITTKNNELSEKSLSLFPSVSDSNKAPSIIIPSNENNNTIPIDEILFKPGRLTRPKNIVIIMRGPPGSGKSHVAKLIKDKEVELGGQTPRLLSIDDYFMVENDYEEKCPKTGRKIPKKEILYEYEKEMEPTYMQYLIKSFKKTVTDHLFDFIIVDCCNESLRSFNEFYNAARDGNFSPFVIDLKCNLETCLEQNIHNRKAEEIKEIIEKYQDCPRHYIKLDVSNLLENVVEMEDVSDLEDHFVADSEVINLDDDEPDDEGTDNNDGGLLKSKWDTDPTLENLARLDGTSKPISKRGTATLEEYLQIDGWQEPPASNTNGKKRVRWADIEEKRAQDKMRAIGFVVGQTDWNRMMDPTSGSGALTKTKYIERLNKRR